MSIETYPLLESQLGIVLECVKNPDSTQYSLPFSFTLPKSASYEKASAAWDSIVRSRKELRTRFVMEDNDIRQYADDDMRIPMEHKIMSEAEFLAYREPRTQHVFKLFSGEPLIIAEFVETEKTNYILFVFHHSISDGTTLLLNFSLIDLPAAYAGQELASSSYGMYEAAQDEAISFDTPLYEKAKLFYAEKFADVEFVTIANSANNPLGNMVRKSAYIPIDEVENWCKEHDTKSSLLFQAAFTLALSRMTRNNKPGYYSITHGRKDKRLLTAYGMFVKSVPMAVEANPQQPVLDFIKAFRAEWTDSISHIVYPFSHFCRDLQVEPRVGFAFQGNKIQELSKLDGEYYKVEQLPKGKVDGDLSCVIYMADDQYEIRVESSEALNTASSLSMFANAVRTVACQMMQKPEAALKDISIVSPEEEKVLIAQSYGGDLAYNKAETFVDMVDGHAKHTPDAVAVVDCYSSLTYAELERKASALAEKLIACGVERNSFVGIMLPRRKEFIVSILGVMKAGAAYVPFDSEYPTERLLYMLSDSQSKMLITTREIFAAKQTEGDFVVDNVLFIDEEALDSACSINHSTPDGLAYMIYTSGSTGLPKGVMLPQRALRAFIAWRLDRIGINSNSRHAVHASFSFDASLDDLLCPLAAGGSVHIFSEELRKDMFGMHEYFKNNSITGLTMPTAFGMAMMQQYDDLSLNFVMMGGEKMLPLAKTSIKIINGYGPTEFTVCSSFHIVDQDKDVEISIGRPVPNTYSYICDALGKLVPQGVAGELCLEGEQISLGYWGREELTAEKFVASPRGGKMYRTGDLARYNADGELEFLGRIDKQVKLRGFRIELGEIEQQIASFPSIQMQSVQVKEIGGVQHLCAYYTANTEIDSDALRAYLAERLTDYMVPTAFMQLDSLPLTPNGKVNGKALPTPEIKAEEIVVAETETEKKLFTLTIELLKHDQFGVTNNLISMGMTSLLAMKFSATIHNELGVAVPVKEIMQHPTLRAIAAVIDGGGVETLNAIVYDKREYYPITENQRGVYIEWEMNRDTTQYNLPDVQEFAGIDAETLAAAVKTVVKAHSALNACFALKNGDVVQMRNDDLEPVVDIITLDHEPKAEYFQQMVKPFNLLEDRLYRFCVVKTPTTTYFFQDIHHTIFDGGSHLAFETDLRRALAGELLEAETYTMFDRAIDEEKWMQSDAFAEAEIYFKNLIAEADVAKYPLSSTPDSKMPGVKAVNAAVQRADIDAFCAKHGFTQNSFFMTSFAQTMHRMIREDKILFTSINNGRDAAEMQSITGMFVKTLPVVSAIQKSGSAADAVSAVQKSFMETVSRDTYPFTKMVEKMSANPEMMFVYQGGIMDISKMNSSVNETQGINDEVIGALSLDTVKFPLMVTVAPLSAEEYGIVLEYDTHLYNQADMLRLCEAVKTVCCQTAENADMAALTLVDESAATALNALSFGKTLDFDHSKTLVDLFSEQARRTPDSICLVFKNKKYSYREMDYLSDRLAVVLQRDYGVKPETAVGVMIDRSELMLLYPMAVMKAGGAYMPLDFHFPADRLQFMCDDAGVELVLSEGKRVAEAMPEFKGKVVTSDIVDTLPAVKGELDPSLKAKPDNMFVILFTSGSTGVPKGVVLEQANIVNFCHWYVKEFDVSPADRAVAYANFGFDAHMMDIYPVTSVGGSVYIIPSEMRMNLVEMNKYMEQEQLNLAFMTTQVGYMFATTLQNKSLRLLSVGGEKLMSLSKPAFRLYNGYGPTECTLYSSFYNIEGYFDGDRSCIGRPLDNYRLFVVDQQMQLVPQGVPGELLVAGVGVGRGYLNRPELTAEKFISFQGEKAYRTGDLVRWGDDGNIEFLGRIDGQVKMRGLRIELGEIEAKVSSCPGVKSCAAAVKEKFGAQHLCCYLIADIKIEAEEMKAYLADKLTEFMIPTVYMQLDSLPLTPNGKINRNALPEPQIERHEGRAPATAREELFCNIFAKLLNLETVYADDDFFKLGGTSLVVMRVVASAYNEGVNITYADVFDNPTPEKLAAMMQNSHIEMDIEDFDDYDYSGINKVLAKNTLDNFLSGELQQMKNVLLTGATGFLGIHVLNQLLTDYPDTHVYCLVRGADAESAAKRLGALYFYYFSQVLQEAYADRISIVNGAITSNSWFTQCEGYGIDTLINCAANVKHFSSGTDIEDVDFHAVETLIDFCALAKVRLVQASTASVGGVYIGNRNEVPQLAEAQLYVGQSHENKYTSAKFQAERAILQAVADGRIEGKIMRLGNLSPRASDGEFQINMNTNSAMMRIRAMHLIACHPFELEQENIEFSPIDATARAVLLLSQTPKENVVFHPYDNHLIPMADICDALNRLQLPTRGVEMPEYLAAMKQTMQNASKQEKLTGLLAYQQSGEAEMYFVPLTNTLTLSVLSRMGMHWPFVGNNYMENFIEKLQGLGYFD